jgi:hypothetical protein
LIVEGEKVYELLFVIDGTIGVGPIMDPSLNNHKPLLFFTRGRIVIGDYSILLEKPAFSTFRAYGDDIVNALAIPKAPFMQLLDQHYP